MNRHCEITCLAAMLLALVLLTACDLSPRSTGPDGATAANVVADSTDQRSIVAQGRIEPVGGEVELSARMTGTLDRVLVTEGDTVEAGGVLAEVEARYEKAVLDAAEAKLRRIKAGNGAEEVAAALAEHEAVLAELTQAERDAKRAEDLQKSKTVADDVAENQRQKALALSHRAVATKQQYEALKRGPLPEEVAAAQAEVDAAKANYDLRLVRAPSSGAVLRLLKHTGDFVSLSYPSPIIRMADMNHLRVRVEIAEPDAARVKHGQEGIFTGFGMKDQTGHLKITTILPAFGPKRLFDPDTTARMDTRTLDVLCEIVKTNGPVFSGQRVIVKFR